MQQRSVSARRNQPEIAFIRASEGPG